MIFRKIKYSFKRRFFKLLSILIVITILFVPFSASALDINYQYPPFTFVKISVFQLFDDGSPPKQIHPSISYNTDGSLQFRFDNKDSYILSKVTAILISFKLTSDLPDGFLYDLSLDLDLTPSINDIWASGGGGFKSLFDCYYSSTESYQGDYHISSSGDHAELSFKGIDASRINDASFHIQNVLYVRESPLFLTFSNIELKGGYPPPDGSAITDYENAESSLISGAQDDFTSVESQAQTSAMARIRHHLNAFQAVTAMFDGFILDSPDFSALLWISLSLSILAVLLGVAFSAASSFSRSKGRDDP